MSIPLFLFGLAGAAALPIVLSLIFVRYYIDKRTGSFLTTVVCAVAISLAFFCVLLVPLDVFTISDITNVGIQEDFEQAARYATGMKALYSMFYLASIIFAFLLMPFAYFYFEEDRGEDGSKLARFCHALKNSLIFLIIFIIVLALSFILNRHSGIDPSDADWKDRIINDFSNLDEFLTFSVSSLALVGLAVYVVYVAYGLAMLPIATLRSRADTVSADNDSLLIERERLTSQLQAQEEISRMDSINNRSERRYGARASESAAARESRRKKADIERQLKEVEERQVLMTGHTDRCTTLWRILTPFRIIFGIVFALLSLLIIAQIGIAAVDRFMHSDCQWSCGFAVNSASVANPIDQLLLLSSTVFPIDLIVYAIIVVYLFVCGVVGLAALGVRCFCIKLYTIRPSGTSPNSMVMGAWLMMFVALVINQQIFSYAPQYSSFGKQFFMKEVTESNFFGLTSDYIAPASISSSSSVPLIADIPVVSPTDISAQAYNSYNFESDNKVDEIGFVDIGITDVTAESIAHENAVGLFGTFVKTECDNEHSSVEFTPTSVCTFSQISIFVHKANNIKLFGIVQFFSSLILCFLFLAFVIYGFCRSTKSFAEDNMQSDDPDAPNYVPEYRNTSRR